MCIVKSIGRRIHCSRPVLEVWKHGVGDMYKYRVHLYATPPVYTNSKMILLLLPINSVQGLQAAYLGVLVWFTGTISVWRHVLCYHMTM